MSRLDAMVRMLEASKKIRETDLREAFCNPDALASLIASDSANLIAGIGGYVAPLDRNEREQWIKNMMLNDPAFVSQVRATANLIREYAVMGVQHAKTVSESGK